MEHVAGPPPPTFPPNRVIREGDLKPRAENSGHKGTRLLSAVARELGPQELLLLVGVALVAYGCYQVYPPAASLVVGAIILYVALPTRAPFILRPDVTVDRPRKVKRPQVIPRSDIGA